MSARLGKAVRWTPQQAAIVQARLAAQGAKVDRRNPFQTVGETPVTKYRSKAIVVDDMRFDSKLEAKRYCQLYALRLAGDVAWFTRQVPFYLPGGVRLVVDFLVCWRSGEITLEDCKGFMTDKAKTKIRIAEAFHKIKIRILKRGDL